MNAIKAIQQELNRRFPRYEIHKIDNNLYAITHQETTIAQGKSSLNAYANLLDQLDKPIKTREYTPGIPNPEKNVLKIQTIQNQHVIRAYDGTKRHWSDRDTYIRNDPGHNKKRAHFKVTQVKKIRTTKVKREENTYLVMPELPEYNEAPKVPQPVIEALFITLTLNQGKWMLIPKEEFDWFLGNNFDEGKTLRAWARSRKAKISTRNTPEGIAVRLNRWMNIPAWLSKWATPPVTQKGESFTIMFPDVDQVETSVASLLHELIENSKWLSFEDVVNLVMSTLVPAGEPSRAADVLLNDWVGEIIELASQRSRSWVEIPWKERGFGVSSSVVRESLRSWVLSNCKDEFVVTSRHDRVFIKKA